MAPHVELARLARLTRIDPLTGVLNRRGLAAVERAEEAQETLGSVICADLDHFTTPASDKPVEWRVHLEASRLHLPALEV